MVPNPKFIRSLPKADLHSHIDGSVPAKDLFRIAQNHGRKMRTPKGSELDSITAFMRFVEGKGYGSLLENVIDRFYPITGLMQTEGTIRDVAHEYVKAQSSEGVAYAEGRFAPQYHTREGMSLKEVIACMAHGLREGAEKFKVRTNLIVAIGREGSPAKGVAVARAAAQSGLVVALDLGGPEAGNPPEKFKDSFEIARSHGLKVTVHSGEDAGSLRRNLANIETAVVELGADRIGHAIHLVGSRRLTSVVRARSVTIEMNPISNLVLRKITDLSYLGIDRLLAERVLITINSDDPALWPRGGLTDVYSAVCSAYGFGQKELDALVTNSFKGAFTTEKEKELLLEEYATARGRTP